MKHLARTPSSQPRPSARSQWRVLSPLFAVIAVALLGGVSARAAGNAKVIKLVAVQVSEKQTRRGFVSESNDIISGKKQGHLTLTCTVVDQTKATCALLVTLAGGTIKGTIILVFAKPNGTGTIMGGTGQYAGATGKLTYRNLNAKGTRTAVVLTLR